MNFKMWAVLFLITCIIDSIGCSIFDGNNGTEYDDFQYGSYSYTDDNDYEDEYNDRVSTDPPRVRRYDRMTHTVPTPTLGMPEIKDALQMLMLGRNLSANAIIEQELEESRFMYPIDSNFDLKMSLKNPMFTKPTIEESIEIPIEFYEIKISTKALTTSEKPMISREQLEVPTRVLYSQEQPTRVVLNEQPTRVSLKDQSKKADLKEQPTRAGFKEHTTAKQYTVRTTTNKATSAKPTNTNFIDMQYEMIPFDGKNINAIKRLKFKNGSQEEHYIIDGRMTNRVVEPTGQMQITEETALEQVYYYEDKNSATEMYIDTRTPLAPITRTKTNILQTVFLYESVPEEKVVLGMDDQEADEDMVTEKWSEEYDPLEYLLTNDMMKGVPGQGLSNALRDGADRSGKSTIDAETGSTATMENTAASTATPNCSTTTAYPFDVEKFLELVANLTYDYYTNLTEELNMTLIRLGAPTCPTPTTVTTTTTTTTETPLPEKPDYAMLENKIMGKCFVCGLVDEGIPWNAHCSDAFAGEFIPLAPVDASAKGYLSKYRKYCRYDDVDHYVENETLPRSIFGRWTGGCGVRWTDISSVYTQRTCRNRNHPTTGRHYASKRMSKLEMALVNTDNGCIVSPAASLIPLSRGISLYARFHACVCTGTWCNLSWRLDSDSDVWKAYVIGVLLLLR